MDLKTILLIIICSLVVLLILLWLILGLYIYNVVMVCKKSNTIEDINENSHWYPFKEELIKRRSVYDEYENTATKHTIINKRGLKLTSYLVKQDQSEIPTLVIFAHGYRSARNMDALYADNWMLKKGYDTLLIDQEGTGESEGKRMGFGIYDSENLDEWIKYVNELYGSKVNIILCGVSMGANTVLLESDKELENVKCIIADCGYTSAYDEYLYLLSNNKLFMCLIRIFLKMFWKRDIKTSSIDALKKAKYPVLFIHGSLDRFVPTKFTYQNNEACRSEKDILIVNGALHAESGLVDPESYNLKIEEFLKNYGK